MANPGHVLTDIEVYYPNKALGAVMAGESMGVFMDVLALEVVARYRARVAKKTGRLMLSATPSSPMGGHKHDRRIAKVTVGGEIAASEWKGKPFYYGVLHNFGSPTKRAQFPAHDDLKAVMETM